MIYCKKCLNTGWYGESYCNKCGTKLENALKCDCGMELHPLVKFCSNCGKKNDKYILTGEVGND